MEDGQTITLSGGTGLENFDIHKLDKPEDAENFNAIAGEDGKNDTLFDTAGNDKIEGKGGCDIIAVLHGGNDWVLGGADDDDVMVKADLTGNILIEGTAGVDMIAGGGGQRPDILWG